MTLFDQIKRNQPLRQTRTAFEVYPQKAEQEMKTTL